MNAKKIKEQLIKRYGAPAAFYRILFFIIGICLIVPLFNCSSAQMLWLGPTEKNVIALTFDDGPNFEGSPALLDILYEKGVKATFFVIGIEAEQNPDLVFRMSDFGHDVGNHTYNHIRMNSASPKTSLEEIRMTNAVIESITGVKPRFFRPPGGSCPPAVGSELKKMGMEMIGWTINAEDYTEFNENFEIEENYQKLADDLAAKVLREARPGAIVLMHNGSKETLLALPKIIDGLRAQGYGFVTVSELTDKRAL